MTKNMKEFPQKLHIKYRSTFRKDHLVRTLSYLRRDIYEHVISSDENDYFVLEDFRTRYKLSATEMASLTEQVMTELKALEWNCATSYNGTALFVYSTPDPPPLCYQDGF